MNERIDDYFEKRLSPEETVAFEDELRNDPELAKSVAFFVTAREAARLEARQEARAQELEKRHAEWQKIRPLQTSYTSLRRWYAAAAILAAIGFGLAWLFLKPVDKDLTALADGYALEHFTTLSVEMGASEDTVQLARALYNKGQYATALKMCQNILRQDPGHGGANELAGIISLKMLEYEQAINYFHQLAAQKNLYANPGKFYEAIALLKSGEPLNKKRAEELLKEVVANNLDGKDEAEKWLKP